MRARLGEVPNRPHQSRRRSRRLDQGRPGVAPQGLAADHQSHSAARRPSDRPIALLRERRVASLAPPRRSSPTRRGERLRLRRQQFPLPARRGRTGEDRDRLGSEHDPLCLLGSVYRVDQNPARRLPARPEAARPSDRGGALPRPLPRGRSPPPSPGARPRGRPRRALQARQGSARRNPLREGPLEGRDLRRLGQAAREARVPLPRPRLAIRRHEPRTRLPFPRSSRRPRPGRNHRWRPLRRPDLPPFRLRRRRARRQRSQTPRHRRRATGDRRDQPWPTENPRTLRRPGRRLRRA